MSKGLNSHTVGQGSVHDRDPAEEHAHMEVLQQQAGSNEEAKGFAMMEK